MPLRKQRHPCLDTPPSEASNPDLSDTQPRKRTFFKKRRGRGRGSGGNRRGGGGVSSREGVHLEAELWENHIQSKQNCQFLKRGVEIQQFGLEGGSYSQGFGGNLAKMHRIRKTTSAALLTDSEPDLRRAILNTRTNRKEHTGYV